MAILHSIAWWRKAMKLVAIAMMLASLTDGTADQPKRPPSNPAIDMTEFLRISNEAAKHRESRRLSEDDFIRISKEPGTIVLDARSKQKFDLLHVKGAINLSFPDIDVASLKKALPDKNARILIYCNNNFVNEEKAFPSKAP